MAHAGKKQIGAGAQGKGDGSGAMSETEAEQLTANAVLSNRDKAQHSRERGQDSKNIQTEQRQDHAANRRA